MLNPGTDPFRVRCAGGRTLGALGEITSNPRVGLDTGLLPAGRAGVVPPHSKARRVPGPARCGHRTVAGGVKVRGRHPMPDPLPGGVAQARRETPWSRAYRSAFPCGRPGSSRAAHGPRQREAGGPLGVRRTLDAGPKFRAASHLHQGGVMIAGFWSLSDKPDCCMSQSPVILPLSWGQVPRKREHSRSSRSLLPVRTETSSKKARRSRFRGNDGLKKTIDTCGLPSLTWTWAKRGFGPKIPYFVQ